MVLSAAGQTSMAVLANNVHGNHTQTT